jgi:lysine 2,3-aminomutase
MNHRLPPECFLPTECFLRGVSTGDTPSTANNPIGGVTTHDRNVGAGAGGDGVQYRAHFRFTPVTPTEPPILPLWEARSEFVSAMLDIENIRDIRLATKGLMGLPQYFLQDDVLRGLDLLASKALERGVDLAVHTHINYANLVTPLVTEVVRKLLAMGFRDVRNQGVLLRGVNDSQRDLLDLCSALLDGAKIMPYYLYLCDMIPNSEHWRLSVIEAQKLQHAIMGYLPGFATPRMVCDVPYVGKRWVHQVDEYDRVRGISYWTKNYRTGIESDDPEALVRRHEYYDPIYTLPLEGQEYWRTRAPEPAAGVR